MGMRRHSRRHEEMNRPEAAKTTKSVDFSLFEPKSYQDPATRRRQEAVVNELKERFNVSDSILYQRHLPACVRLAKFKENVVTRWNEILTTPHAHRQIAPNEVREFRNLASQLRINLDFPSGE